MTKIGIRIKKSKKKHTLRFPFQILRTSSAVKMGQLLTTILLNSILCSIPVVPFS